MSSSGATGVATLAPRRPQGQGAPQQKHATSAGGVGARRTLKPAAEGGSPSHQTESDAAHLAHKLKHRKPTLEEVIQSVFESLEGEYGEQHGIDVPINFYDFYESPLFRHFIACIVYYYFAYVEVRRLEAVQDPSVSLKIRRRALDQGVASPKSQRTFDFEINN